MNSASRFGPLLTNKGVSFRLWAPAARRVSLMLDRTIEMERSGNWFEMHVAGAGAGTHYRFRIDDEIDIPDPASHFQPHDVNGPSEVIDHTFAWQQQDWKGLPWNKAVLLEAHVGTYTAAGTFRSMVARLDHLVETGITALELMPVADFPGRWNWGYDGVLPFAPDSAYGRPEDLKTLIDAAHARGLMVFLDVVYNHFGPEGNYLGRIAPCFFSSAQTPWGGAIDYEVPEVRAFAIENALHWLREYRFDGLRLDAVHAIVSRGKPDILSDLSKAVGNLVGESGRHIHLVLENDDNDARLLAPAENPPRGHYRAQWNDDYHHAWHVYLTGESTRYYSDYSNPGWHLNRALSQGFSYQGERSRHRGGRKRGIPIGELPRTAFINFLQNHDQIGNRPLGKRLTVLMPESPLMAAFSVLLLQPSPPLIFMGDEWGATEPFPFFCDFKGELAEAVRQGRRKEFAEAYAKFGDEIPDPLARETRQMAVLNWDAGKEQRHSTRLLLTRSLLAIRKQYIEPLLPALTHAGSGDFSSGVLNLEWPAGEKALLLLANLTNMAKPRPTNLKWGQPIWGNAPSGDLPAWSVYAAIGGT